MATIEKRARQGKNVYRVKIRLRGHLPADATFDRITDAKRWASETETAIRSGRWLQNVAAKRVTLDELIDRYEREYLAIAAIRTNASRVKRLKFWRNEYGHLPLADITVARVLEARAKLLKSVNRVGERLAPATANQYVGDLRHCFAVAKREFCVIAENPLTDIQKLREPRGRVRFLTTEERVALQATCKSHSETLHTLVFIALIYRFLRRIAGSADVFCWREAGRNAGTVITRRSAGNIAVKRQQNSP